MDVINKMNIPRRLLKVIQSPEQSILLTRKFERALADCLRAEYAVAINSCTSALMLALQCLGIKKGDEIIVTPLSWPSTWFPGSFLGAKLVPVDLSREFPVMDASQIKPAISSKTKAIIGAGLWGYSAGIKEAYQVAKENGLPFILDAAQIINATVENKGIGTLGDLVVTSFSSTKKRFALGEGGAILTNKRIYLDRLLLLSQHPIRNYLDIDDLSLLEFNEGFNHNCRMHPFAVLLGSQLIARSNSHKRLLSQSSTIRTIKSLLKSHSITEIKPPKSWASSKPNDSSLLLDSACLPQKLLVFLKVNLQKYSAFIKKCPYKPILELRVFKNKIFFPWQNGIPLIKNVRVPNAEYWAKNLLIISVGEE
jgi:dTDP-4-amino-4,6-dideoxygalactose transaminase